MHNRTASPDDGIILMDSMQAELAGIVSYDSYKLTQQIAEVRVHNDQIANFLMGLPQRTELEFLAAQCDALMAENEGLRSRLGALEALVRAKVA